ncbi:MAG TPA: hypothetical protein VMZ53_17785 [Kofleriaceae bacterium]|nr:hypothetical protein [Kofleriaceae bacterium]
MRALSVLLAFALTTACIYNPDPREPTLADTQRKGFGAWIVVTARDGSETQGELLAIDNGSLFIKTRVRKPVVIPLHTVQGADVYTYESDWGFGVWGLLGTLSTASHGLILIFSAPIWMLSASIAAGVESAHIRLQIPDDDIDEIRKWARYPQGMPKQSPTISRKEDAWAFTQQAQVAARMGNCEAVTKLEPRVLELDVGLHDMTFMRDEAIRRCLGLPSLIAPPSMVPPSTPPDAGVTP